MRIPAAAAAVFSVFAAVPAWAGFSLDSPDIAPGATITAAHVFQLCNGGNVSPALSWRGAPAGTKSFALTLYDPDAPTGSGFWHWVVWDIPSATTSLPERAGDPKSGLMPTGAMQGRNDYSLRGYGGPCPPHGDPPHHYIFTVFATDLPSLGVGDDPSPAVVGFTLHFHTLAKATLTGRYGD